MKKKATPPVSTPPIADNSRIVPVKAEHRQLYSEVEAAGREVERLAFNREDYRYMLTVSNASTEDFLSTTSKDPNYARYTIDSITLKNDNLHLDF